MYQTSEKYVQRATFLYDTKFKVKLKKKILNV